jgi:hypothetical protein
VIFDVPNDTAAIPLGDVSYKVYYDTDNEDGLYPVMRAVDEILRKNLCDFFDSHFFLSFVDFGEISGESEYYFFVEEFSIGV